MSFLKNHKHRSGSSLVAHREGPIPMGAKFPMFRFGHRFYKENWKEQRHTDTKSEPDTGAWCMYQESAFHFNWVHLCHLQTKGP